MKRTMILALLLGVLVVCPLFADENRVAERSDEPAACQADDTAVAAAAAQAAAGAAGAAAAVSRPNLRLQTNEGCGLSCWWKIMVSTDFGQDVAPYPAFWVKVAACEAKCAMME